jgi:hypothetical protein
MQSAPIDSRESRRSPSWSPCGPSTYRQLQRPAFRTRLAFRASSSPGLPHLALQRPRGFSPPRRFTPRAAFLALFRASTVLGLSSLRRFLPNRSPGSLSARSVLRVVAGLAPGRLRGFRHRLDALRLPRMVSADSPRSFPGCFSPSRYRPLLVSLRASASLLSWASFDAMCLATHRLACCSSEFQRTGRLARLALRLPPWGSCRPPGDPPCGRSFRVRHPVGALGGPDTEAPAAWWVSGGPARTPGREAKRTPSQPAGSLKL